MAVAAERRWIRILSVVAVSVAPCALNMSSMFVDLYPDVPVPKIAWQWVESAQYRLLRAGAHRAMSCVDLLICACAAVRGLVVLHDDNNFVTAAQHLPDLAERRVHSLPDRT